MTRYRVEFSDAAEAELIESTAWGIDAWGEEAAFRWAREMRDKVHRLLETSPLGCPLAPESEFSELEIRQLIIGRYRVLFNIDKRIVILLHIRGPFTGAS